MTARISEVEGLPFTRLEVFRAGTLIHDAEYDHKREAVERAEDYLGLRSEPGYFDRRED